jgi:hypothetical protein
MAGASAQAEPFPVRDQNPLIRGVYLPISRTAMAPGTSWQQDFTLTISNTTNIEARDAEELLVDGEATELRWNGRWQLAGRWQLQFSVPVVHYSGGRLDSTIDDWHRLLGLPRGDRPLRPEDQLEYAYQAASGRSLSISDGHTGLADSSVEAGLTAVSTAAVTVDLWIGLELPTGETDALTGNGALDVAGWISGHWRLASTWALDATLGVSRPGSVDPLPLEPNSVVPFGTAALSWTRPRYGLALQLDAHDSCVEDSRLDFLGPATLLTVGGHYQTPGGWRLELAVTEDVRVGASPDVAFYFGIRRQD